MPSIDKAEAYFWLLILDALNNYGYRLVNRIKVRNKYGHPFVAVDEATLERVRTYTRHIAEGLAEEDKIFE